MGRWACNYRKASVVIPSTTANGWPACGFRTSGPRSLYLLGALAIGIGAWPEIIRPGTPWDLIPSVAFSLYETYSLLLLVGVALLIAVVRRPFASGREFGWLELELARQPRTDL
jgi:hypothetical protein